MLLSHTMRTATRSLLRPLSHGLLGAFLILAGASQGTAQTQAHTTIQGLLQSGQAQQALGEAQRALEATPRDPQLQFLKANAELALGQSEAADATLTQLTQTYPELPEPWNNLATLRASQGRLSEARQLLEQALINNPDYVQAHNNLAQILVQQAIAHVEAAQKQAPQASHDAHLKALRAAAATWPSPSNPSPSSNQ